MIDNTTLQSAIDGRFTEFTDKIRTELIGKLSNNERIKEYNNIMDDIDTYKLQYSQIVGGHGANAREVED